MALLPQFLPLHDRILVLPLDPASTTAAGIHISASALDRSQPGQRGRVVAVGTGHHGESEATGAPWQQSLTVRPGDIVHFGRYHGADKVVVGGVEHVVLREDALLGVERVEDSSADSNSHEDSVDSSTLSSHPSAVANLPLPAFLADERVAPGEIRLGTHDGPLLMKNIQAAPAAITESVKDVQP